MCYFTKFSVPVIITFLVGSSQGMIASIAAGHLGDENLLAGFGLGGTLNAIFLTPFIMGTNAAQDMLTTQAFGSGNL